MGSQWSKGVLQRVPVSEHKQQVDDVTCFIAHKRHAGHGASHTIHLSLVFTDRSFPNYPLQDTFLPCLPVNHLHEYAQRATDSGCKQWLDNGASHTYVVGAQL